MMRLETWLGQEERHQPADGLQFRTQLFTVNLCKEDPPNLGYPLTAKEEY